MSFMDELRRLARPYEDDDDFLDEDLEEPFAEPREDRKARRKREDRDDDLDTGYTSVNNDKVVNINTTTQLQVVLVKPDRYENASEIADHLRDKRTVVLNLESTNKDVARRMVEHGCKLSIEEIGKGMIDYVAQKEFERIPWIDGVEDVLLSLKEAGVPSMLVTTSPRHLAENLIAQAPAGTFAGYVCGDDDVEKKPSPAPYLAAGRKLGIAPEDMKYCIAVEDSMSGLRSAAASGATTLGQTGFMRIDNSNGPQFASINGYDGITTATLDAYIRRRNA